jgi:hypothetical protein
MDPVIRPDNSLLLIAPQSAEGVAATLDPTLHAVPIEAGSFTYGEPFGSEETNETNGSYVASAPLIIGQEVPLSFRSRIKGAGPGTAYTNSVKPPLHTAFQACGWRGQFTAGIGGANSTGGDATSLTLPVSYSNVAQTYRGQPLQIAASGAITFVTDYTSGRVATLTDLFSPPLAASTNFLLLANWTYAGTSPTDAASRLTDHPPHTVGYYEDGNLYQWQDVRGVLDLEGTTARPGFGAFSMSGTYIGSSTVTMPTNAVIATHSAPLLAKGTAVSAAFLMNRRELPIRTWALRNGGALESVEDPNTTYGFGPGQIAMRRPVFECDPLRALVGTRDAIAEMQAALNYPGVLRCGNTLGNRWALVLPVAQPIRAASGMRGRLRSDDLAFQALNPGRGPTSRDGDRFLTFY